MSISGTTRLYGIIGDPVRHSLSPAMHNAAFRALDLDCAYLPFAAPDAQAALVGLAALGISGASVTIPHKERVIPLLDEVEPLAAAIGAVNTIQVRRQQGEARLVGSNSDWQGANQALLEVTTLKDKKVVLLGAGGSARAIGFGLGREGAQVELCSRTESRGRALARDLDCAWRSLAEVDQLSGDILVNATSVGMNAPEISPLPAEVTARFPVVMDIVYAPLATRLLRDAEDSGCRVINGLEMLLYQGVAQFELWTGQAAPVDVMRQALLRGLEAGA